jgi:HD-like signal output (HDOD) protein
MPAKRISELIAPGSVMQRIFEGLDRSIESLPTLPEPPQQVIHAAHDPLTASGDLAALITRDAMMTVRMLNLANSVAAQSRSRITDMQYACARLGIRTIVNVAYVSAHSHFYQSTIPAFRELMQHLWRHSIATARLAEILAPSFGVQTSTSLFLMGLVHDIGKPVLLQAITAQHKDRVGRLKGDWDLLVDALDIFAPYAGLRVVQRWGLPVEMGFAAFYLADPGAAPAAYALHAKMIALASAAAEQCGYGVIGRTPADAHALCAKFAQELPLDKFDFVLESAKFLIEPYLDLT